MSSEVEMLQADSRLHPHPHASTLTLTHTHTHTLTSPQVSRARRNAAASALAQAPVRSMTKNYPYLITYAPTTPHTH